jgi:hypothetical protein
MPSPPYEKNKQHVLNWKEKNKDKALEIARRGSKSYYEKNAQTILEKKKKRRMDQKKEVEENIL